MLIMRYSVQLAYMRYFFSSVAIKKARPLVGLIGSLEYPDDIFYRLVDGGAISSAGDTAGSANAQ